MLFYKAQVFYQLNFELKLLLALVNLRFKCFGPDLSAVINGKFISVCAAEDNSIFAFSAASLSL